MYAQLMHTTRWSAKNLRESVARSFNIRQVLLDLDLVPAGGNYERVRRRISELDLDTSHFGGTAIQASGFSSQPIRTLKEILVAGSFVQSYKLKKRLFAAGLKLKSCELCGWAQYSPDGRLPLELDHINGDRHDNRLENLRILCPNCHSLQLTHRGLNKSRPGGEIGYTRET